MVTIDDELSKAVAKMDGLRSEQKALQLHIKALREARRLQVIAQKEAHKNETLESQPLWRQYKQLTLWIIRHLKDEHGMTPANIARALPVSSQRVHRVCRFEKDLWRWWYDSMPD